MIGLGLGITFGNGAPVASDDPDATLDALAWSGAWSGDGYDAGTGIATGIATDGSSGGRNFTAPGTKPAKGNAVNGHDGIIFDGTSKYLNGSFNLSDLINADAYLVYIVARYDGFGGAGASGYDLPAPICDTGSYFAAGGADGATPKKATGYHYGATEEIARAEITASTVHLIEIMLSAGTLSVTVDEGTPATDPSATDVALLTGTMRMGTTYGAATHFNGTIYEVRTSDSVFDAGTRSTIRDALSTKYGL